LSPFATRQLTDRDRSIALALACTVLIGLAVLLSATRHNGPHAHHQPSARHRAASAAARPQSAPTKTMDAARRFMAGYLRYLDAQGSARSIHSATTALTRSLAAHPLLVSPSERAAHPRVLTLTAGPSANGLARVRVEIGNGGLIDYQLMLLLTRRHGRMLVSAVRGQ
jgi:hypothetical protein